MRTSKHPQVGPRPAQVRRTPNAHRAKAVGLLGSVTTPHQGALIRNPNLVESLELVRIFVKEREVLGLYGTLVEPASHKVVVFRLVFMASDRERVSHRVPTLPELAYGIEG